MKNRLAQNDRIEFIDKSSTYFGKTGIVKYIRTQPLQMLHDKSGTMTSIEIELDDTADVVSITDHPTPLNQQIRKL